MLVDELSEPWCATCGSTLTQHEILNSSGDCDLCEQWWVENALKDDDEAA